MIQAKLYAIPVTIKAAMKFVSLHHRYLPRVGGGLFAVGVGIVGETKLRGVAIVAHPARLAMDGWTCEITRCATDGTPNACSFLYGRCRRVAQTLGYRVCGTKTLIDEPGASLRAAGAMEDGLTRDQSWDRPSRKRSDRKTGRKKRWALL